MSVVYGIRLRGDNEPRYIGKTRRGVEFRLARHIYHAAAKSDPLSRWLRANKDRVEGFEIADSDDAAVVAGAERLAIAMCLAFGHRIFNQVHVPMHRRQDAA